jgi:hypothetical protein
MQFRWSDFSNVDQPGTYVLPDSRRVKIDSKHIVMWMHDPDGVFDAYLYPGDKQRPAEYTLTDFHASEELVPGTGSSIRQTGRSGTDYPAAWT